MKLANLEQIRLLINNHAVSEQSIQQTVGINQDIISQLRNGELDFGDLTIDTLIGLQEYIDLFPPTISIDYQSLLDELKADYKEKVVGSYVYVIRKKEVTTCTTDYHQVIDYVDVNYPDFKFYEELKESNLSPEDYMLEIMNTSDLIDELKKWNSTIR